LILQKYPTDVRCDQILKKIAMKEENWRERRESLRERESKFFSWRRM